MLIIVSGNSRSGVGEQFIQAMIDRYPKKCIFRFSPVITDANSKMVERGYHSQTQVVSYSKYPLIAQRSSYRYDNSELPLASATIQDLVEQYKIDVVWVFMNSWYTIKIGAELAQCLEIPMITHVWDSPEYLASKMYLLPKAKKDLLSAFGTALRKSQKVITVSDSMSAIYKEKYGVESATMVFCPPISSWRTPKDHKDLEDKSVVKIIFAGSLYAYDQWNRFLDAVQQENKRNVNRKIEVTCVGNTSRWAKKRKWVSYLPLQPIDKAASLVNEADIAYLPYWMSKKHAYFVKTAFPGKMSFYVASGTPVLFHGPTDSTPTDFLKKNKVGLACNTMEKADIIEKINELMSEDFRTQYERSQKKTLEKVFHPDRCVETFSETIRQIT